MRMRRFSTVLYDVVSNCGLSVHTIVDTSAFLLNLFKRVRRYWNEPNYNYSRLQSSLQTDKFFFTLELGKPFVTIYREL